MSIRGAILSVFLAAGPATANPQMTEALNSLRLENGSAPVAYSMTLETAAKRHARDMAQNNVFSHTGSDGSDVGARVSETGYGWCLSLIHI